MWHNPAHMTAGHAAAAASRKTPKHLRAHLKGLSMKSVKGNSPTTGAATQMKPMPQSGADGTTQQAMSQIKNAPRPFGNPRVNPITTAPAAGPKLGVGSGKSPNSGGNPTSKPPKHPPTGPTGGYKPKKNYGPVGKPSFYGSR